MRGLDTNPAVPNRLARVADAALIVTALTVVALLVFGPRLGHETEDQVRLLRVVAAGLSLLLVLVFIEVRALRRQVLVMEDLLSDVRFGAGTKRDRDAIDILVRALRVSDAATRETALRTLRKLAGQDLGDKSEAWEAWWKASRETFTRSSATAAAGGPKK